MSDLNMSMSGEAGLTFVGMGKEGLVYRIDANRCIKYHNKAKYQRRELAALRMGQGDPHFPLLLGWGKKYIIREYIEGRPLVEHLAESPLTSELVQEIVNLYEALLRLGYRRADLRLAHVILTPAGSLRVIDPTNMMRKDRTFPRKALHDLEKLGHLESFLAWISANRPDLARKWRIPGPAGKEDQTGTSPRHLDHPPLPGVGAKGGYSAVMEK